jgi:hypothetical protein
MTPSGFLVLTLTACSCGMGLWLDYPLAGAMGGLVVAAALIWWLGGPK